MLLQPQQRRVFSISSFTLYVGVGGGGIQSRNTWTSALEPETTTCPRKSNHWLCWQRRQQVAGASVFAVTAAAVAETANRPSECH